MTQVRKGNHSGVDQHHKHLVHKLHFYQRKCHNHRRQTTLATIAIKTIELVSQPSLACRNLRMLVHPSREVRYDCSKPKGNTCIQVVFTQSPVSLTTTSEYLPASGILDPLCICTRLHKQLQLSKERKSYLTCLRHCKTVQTSFKNMKNKLTTKFPVSFQNTAQDSFHYLHSSGRFQ